MNGDHNFGIVGGDHHSDQIPADIAKITRVTTLISFYFHRIQNDRPYVSLGPSLPAHFVLGVVGESHPPLRAQHSGLSPS